MRSFFIVLLALVFCVAGNPPGRFTFIPYQFLPQQGSSTSLIGMVGAGGPNPINMTNCNVTIIHTAGDSTNITFTVQAEPSFSAVGTVSAGVLSLQGFPGVTQGAAPVKCTPWKSETSNASDEEGQDCVWGQYKFNQAFGRLVEPDYQWWSYQIGNINFSISPEYK